MDDMEFAHEARKACEVLNHRLYVVNVEKKWDEGIPHSYIDGVIECHAKLRDIMEDWNRHREEMHHAAWLAEGVTD